MSVYRLSELLDMTLVQKLAESNYLASGLPMSIIDAFDTSILVSAGWQDICTQFHRVNPLSRARCLESDNRARDHADSRVPYQYKCENGIWHIATPIVAAGHHLATMFLTQFNFEGEGQTGNSLSGRRMNSATILTVISMPSTGCLPSAQKRLTIYLLTI